MKQFILIIMTAMGLPSFIGTAAPAGICLHAYGPDIVAEKIECFEISKIDQS